MALLEIIALRNQTKSGRKSVAQPVSLLCQLFPRSSSFSLLFLEIFQVLPWLQNVWIVVTDLTLLSALAPASNPFSFSPLLFCRVWIWSGLGHVASPPALSASHLFVARWQLSGAEWHRPIYNSPQATDRDEAGRGNNTTIREKSPELPAPLFMMATNREHQLRHMTEFPRTMYPFTFNSMRSHSPFDLLASSHLFGRFGADLPKEMAALCK